MTPLPRTSDPAVWLARLDSVKPEYRGWAASFVWWRYSEPHNSLKGQKRDDHIKRWNQFKRQEVPSGAIPETLYREVLDEELKKVGYEPTKQMLQARAHAMKREAALRQRRLAREQTI